jgi:hypothetical protein
MELSLSLAVAVLVAVIAAVGLSYVTIYLDSSLKKMIISHLKEHSTDNDTN